MRRAIAGVISLCAFSIYGSVGYITLLNFGVSLEGIVIASAFFILGGLFALCAWLFVMEDWYGQD